MISSLASRRPFSSCPKLQESQLDMGEKVRVRKPLGEPSALEKIHLARVQKHRTHVKRAALIAAENRRVIDSSPIAGSGIMSLNNQIKRRMPQLSIDDRSRLVTDIWSNMSKDERTDMMSHGFREWICDPHRIEISTTTDSLEAYAKSKLHASTFHTSIPFIQLPKSRVFRSALLTRDSKAIKGSEISEAATGALNTMKRAIAKELSTYSEEPPDIYLKKSKADTIYRDRIRAVADKGKKKRKRLRAYSALSIHESARRILEKSLEEGEQ